MPIDERAHDFCAENKGRVARVVRGYYGEGATGRINLRQLILHENPKRFPYHYDNAYWFCICAHDGRGYDIDGIEIIDE